MDFDAIGEVKLRKMLADGRIRTGSPRERQAIHWLDTLDRHRQGLAEDKAEARAIDQQRTANSAKNAAWVAALAAIAALIFSGLALFRAG